MRMKWTCATAVAIILCCHAGIGPAATPTSRELRPIGEVLALPLEVLETKPSVTVRGVTIWRNDWSFVIQDDTDGMYVDVHRAAEAGIWTDHSTPNAVEVGTVVEVEGDLIPAGFSPAILPRAIRVIEKAALPPPKPFDAERFFSGADICRIVQVTGVVRGVSMENHRYRLTAETQGRTFEATLGELASEKVTEPLLDAVVQFTGVAMPVHNTRGELVQIQLYLDHPEWLTVVTPAGDDPFAGPFVPLASLGRFRREPLRGHMIRTEGTVVHAVPGQAVHLQEGINGVVVQTYSTEAFEPGDRVQVAGFLDHSGRVARLAGALVRKSGRDAPPTAHAVTPDEVLQVNQVATTSRLMALPGDYDGCLITFEATLVERQSSDDRGIFVLASGKTGAVAYADPLVFRALDHIKVGSLLAVTGIAESVPAVNAASSPLQKIDRVALLLRSANDIRVIRAPSWWTPRRVMIMLASALALLAGGALAAAGWIILLRSQVARQFAVIQDKLHAEAVAEERRRIAREFHDSLDQGLAGLSLRLDAAARQTGDAEARGVLLQQHRFLASLQNEARNFLWDLRYPTHVEGLLADSIRAQLLYMGSLTPLPLELEDHGPPIALPQMEHYQLVRIVREAVNNSIRHARAQRITVHLGGAVPDSTPGFVQVVVQDDGVGFDVATRANAVGHFGVRGMQERSRRIGAELLVDSVPGRGTRVVVRLPLRKSAADEHRAALTAGA